jgi:hypothetical protein
MALALFIMACGLFAPKGSGSEVAPQETNPESNFPVLDFEAKGQPVNVAVDLDENDTVGETITPKGGSLTLNASDGSVYSLEVPSGALDGDYPITMTVVSNLEGAPLDGEKVFAVQLEPSGLLFNEILTLTITPSQVVPIDQQIIFGYEGNGQDYHLAPVDPNSEDIKIKLMGFSGAGMGSGGDAAWAKNLSIQADGARERLAQEFGKVTQAERQRQLLGETDDDTPSNWGGQLQSNLEQFYDQVVMKELAAAELDCQYAQQAAKDLLQVERQKQLLGLGASDKPKIVDLEGKLDKLQKIYDKCKVAYHIKGSIDEAEVEGDVCDARKPFTLSGMLTFSFTPTNGKMGAYSYSGPFDAVGAGPYLIYDNGTMLVSGYGCVMDQCATYDHTWTATRIDPENCSE